MPNAGRIQQDPSPPFIDPSIHQFDGKTARTPRVRVPRARVLIEELIDDD